METVKELPKDYWKGWEKHAGAFCCKVCNAEIPERRRYYCSPSCQLAGARVQANEWAKKQKKRRNCQEN